MADEAYEKKVEGLAKVLYETPCYGDDDMCEWPPSREEDRGAWRIRAAAAIEYLRGEA